MMVTMLHLFLRLYEVVTFCVKIDFRFCPDSCWEKRTSRSPRVRGLGRETGREEEEREEARRAADSLKEELVLVQQRAATW